MAQNTGSTVPSGQVSPSPAEVFKTPLNWTPKHDLLYMYVCLGHLPDRRLTLGELNRIVEKFKHWIPDADGKEFDRVMRDVLKHYRRLSDFQKRFDQYMKSAFMLRDFFEDDEARLIGLMDDLVAIADADREISFEEIVLIKCAVKAWWLDLDPCVDQVEKLSRDISTGEGEAASVDEDSSWGKHHDLLYLYVCMGHLPDREFSFEEVSTIMRCWRRRFPQMSQDEFQRIRTAVMNRYNLYETTSQRLSRFILSARNLKRTYRGKARKLTGILKDLFDIARADDTVHENEIALLDAVAREWELELNFSSPSEGDAVEMKIIPAVNRVSTTS